MHLIDCTTPVRAARSASPPTSLMLPAVNVENVAYRSSDGHLHELWRDPRSIGTTDLTANARATAAKGNPFSYLDPTTNSVILLYRGTDDHVHSLELVDGRRRSRRPHGFGQRAEDRGKSGRVVHTRQRASRRLSQRRQPPS